MRLTDNERRVLLQAVAAVDPDAEVWLHGSRVREALENLKEKVEGVIMTYEHPFSRSDHEAIDGPGQVTMGEVRGGRVVRAYEDGRKKSAK